MYTYNRKNSIFIFFLIGISLLLSCSVRYDKEQEENDTYYTAQQIFSGRPLKATIDRIGDIDFYKITLKQDISKDVLADIAVAESEGLDLLLKVYNEKKTVKIINDTSIDNGTAGQGERIVNILFHVDQIIEGNAFFSIENLSGETENKIEGKKEYTVFLEVREREADEEGEPNDKPVTATDFGMNTIMRGYFNPSINSLNGNDELQLEEDWYSFSLSEEDMQLVNISHTGVPGVDTQLMLFDELGYAIRQANSFGQGNPEKLKNIGLNKGKYFIKLASSAPYQQNSTIGYLLKIEKEKRKNLESEPNDKYPFANRVSFSQEINGCINPVADIDWYRCNIYEPERQVLSVKVSPTADMDPVIELHSSSTGKIISVNDRKTDEGEILKNIGVEQGVYYIKLYDNDQNMDNPDNEYTLILSKESWKDDEEYELNNNLNTANELVHGGLKKGYISPKGDTDFYLYRVIRATELVFEITPCVLLDLAFNIYNQDGEVIRQINNNPAEEGEKLRIFLSDGTYYLEVFSVNKTENSRDNYIVRVYS